MLMLVRQRNQASCRAAWFARPSLLQPGFGLHPFFRGELGGGRDCQPIRADALPFLDQHVVGFEEAADAIALPSRNLFQNRRQYGQRAGAQIVRLATWETFGASETAMVSPSRALMCNMTWISELPSPVYTT